jgi:hypothetical protein
MALHKNHERERIRLEGEIVRQLETIGKLQAQGHSCPDAQRQLEYLKDSLSLFN